MYIVFFDSGLGGLNPLKEAVVQMPGENFIYFGDTANVPYGVKSEELIRKLMVGIIDGLAPRGLKAFVIACNTATCAAAAFLRGKYELPIIGMEPAVKPAVALAGGKRVLALGTELTLRADKFKRLKDKVDPDSIVDSLPLPELVERVERLNFDQAGAADFLRKKLAGFNLNDYGCVVLGCTHFDYFREALEDVFPAGVRIIDGNAGTVKYLAEIISYRPDDSAAGQGEILLHLSNRAETDKIEAARAILEKAAPGRVTVF